MLSEYPKQSKLELSNPSPASWICCSASHKFQCQMHYDPIMKVQAMLGDCPSQRSGVVLAKPNAGTGEKNMVYLCG